MKELLSNIADVSNNRIIQILLVILFALIAQAIAHALLKNVLKFPLSGDWFPKQKRERDKRIKTLHSILSALVTLGIWFVAVLLILGILNVPIAPLLTSAGLIGAALAFGMQSLIKDFISGIFIIAENQYRVDDYIELDKASGKVEAISVRTTVLRDDNGSLHFVPNGSVVVSSNLSMGPVIMREQIQISADMTVTKLKAKISATEQSFETDEMLRKLVKKGPVFESFDKIGGTSTTITIRYETTAEKRNQARSVVLEKLLESGIPLA